MKMYFMRSITGYIYYFLIFLSMFLNVEAFTFIFMNKYLIFSFLKSLFRNQKFIVTKDIIKWFKQL